MITLTIRSAQEPLSELLDRLYKSYRRLQRSKLWLDHVTGAVGFVEVTFNRSKSSWHPHIHIVASGSYLPHKLLSSTWLSITGDSQIVDIRRVRDPTEVSSYIAKYATKPSWRSYIDLPDRLDEAIQALHGRRLMIRSGDYLKLPLKLESDIRDLVPILTLSNLLQESIRKMAAPMAILRRLLRIPTQPDPWTHPPPDCPD